jgi:hypothetical protein
LETTAHAPRANDTRFAVLAGIAIAGYLLTEYLRRVFGPPTSGLGPDRLFWFLSHALFQGKFLVLGGIALAPLPPIAPRLLIAAAGVLLMLGSFLQLGHPLYLLAIGVLLGSAYKQVPQSDQLHIVFVIAGLGLGIPLSGFTGLMIAKANFEPKLAEVLANSTAAIGSAAIALAYLGIYSLLWRLLSRSRS